MRETDTSGAILGATKEQASVTAAHDDGEASAPERRADKRVPA